ncbi:hypothetical protein [Acetobacter pomorum]|nr:hypothetical protein [Acetobacter pomorum]
MARVLVSKRKQPHLMIRHSNLKIGLRDFSFSSGLCGALVLSGAMFAFSDFANAQTTATLSSLLNQDQDKIERASKPEGVTVSDHPKSKTLKNHKKIEHVAPHVLAGKASEQNRNREIKNNKDLSEDLLLKGLPDGWSAHVVGINDTRMGGAQRATESSAASDHSSLSDTQSKDTSTDNTLRSVPGQGSEDRLDNSDSTNSIFSSHRILIPVPANMGLAAYQSGRYFVIVVDNAEPMNTSALRGDGIFAGLSVETIADATIITIPLVDTRQLYLSQQSNGWILGDEPPPGNDYGDRRVINPRLSNDGLLFPLRHPGRVLSIKDPATGRTVLIGTSASDDGGILSLRLSHDYDVWPSLEGIIIDDHAPPTVEMKATPEGDLLSINGKNIPDPSEAVFASDVDLKWLGLKNQPLDQLQENYRAAVISAADSEPADRFAKRLEAAKAAFGVGAFPDARAIMTVALEDDPEEAFRTDVRFLLGAIELMCGNVDGAALLDGPWPDGDKRATQMWKGLYHAAAGGDDEEAAHLLATDFDRLLNYPQSLKDVLLAPVTEHIARYGKPEDRLVLDKVPESSFAKLARVLSRMRDIPSDAHKDDKAITDVLTEFSDLAGDKDPSISEKAVEAGTILRLKSGLLSPEDAALVFSQLLPDGRLSGREVSVRMAQADAYIRAKRWSDALAALDKAQRTLSSRSEPDITPMVYQALSGIAQEANPTNLKSGQAQPSLIKDAAMLRAHLPDIPPGPQKADVLMAYGKMLLNLGLTDEASQAFSNSVPMFQDPVSKAIAGEGLADSFIQRGMFDEASEALANTNSPGLPKDVLEGRGRVAARIAMSSGKPEVALYLLGTDQNDIAADMRARIHEARDEWSPAVSDVILMVKKRVPEAGELNIDQQLLCLRLASDASRAGDVGTLEWISNRVGDRKFARDTERLFRLLVSSP